MRAIPTVLLDVLLVIVFCVIGRLSHAEGVFGDPLATLNTLWPFVVGVLLGHLGARALRLRADRIAAGSVIWIAALVVGMLLRLASQQGVAVSFMIVAACVLALFLIGWRCILALVRGSRARRR